ncbi:hypothetical protein B0H13DRAFT_1890616 [Mycena leptocephala]|nr:hypothetical protein B0H13DRAFT_1890616 [Mycena leptocephala]
MKYRSQSALCDFLNARKGMGGREAADQSLVWLQTQRVTSPRPNTSCNSLGRLPAHGRDLGAASKLHHLRERMVKPMDHRNKQPSMTSMQLHVATPDQRETPWALGVLGAPVERVQVRHLNNAGDSLSGRNVNLGARDEVKSLNIRVNDILRIFRQALDVSIDHSSCGPPVRYHFDQSMNYSKFRQSSGKWIRSSEIQPGSETGRGRLQLECTQKRASQLGDYVEQVLSTHRNLWAISGPECAFSEQNM